MSVDYPARAGASVETELATKAQRSLPGRVAWPLSTTGHCADAGDTGRGKRQASAIAI